MQSPGKLPGNIKIKHISAITHHNSTKVEILSLFRQSLKRKEKNHIFGQFPGNLHVISKIKQTSAITPQNSTKFEN